MPRPELGQIQDLPDELAILPGTEVSKLWKPFRFFEAGHHDMSIMNPLSSAGLDQVIEMLEIEAGQRVLDIACGHGETLLRLAAEQPIEGTGVDISPWTLRRAHERLEDAATSDVQLILGDGRSFVEQNQDGRWDVILLLGAPWIFGGFEPSVLALMPQLRPGGQLVIADVVATDAEARQRLDELYDNPSTAEEQRAQLSSAGLCDIREIPATAQDWRDYDDRVMAGTKIWLEIFPQDASFMEAQLDYERRRADDADVGWTVWMATPCLRAD